MLIINNVETKEKKSKSVYPKVARAFADIFIRDESKREEYFKEVKRMTPLLNHLRSLSLQTFNPPLGDYFI